MVQCVACGTWQHKLCMFEDTKEAVPAQQPVYHCDRCRVELADPYWQTLDWVGSSHFLQDAQVRELLPAG
jgi:hypothetical protein